jgi:uncharacterized protein involved in type VI secretion and phage assembly
VSLPRERGRPRQADHARIELAFGLGGLSADVRAFYAEEAISETPRYHVTFESDAGVSDPESLLGASGQLVIQGPGIQGSFSGVASAISVGSDAFGRVFYSVTFGSELTRLSLDAGYRIFQDESLIDSLQRVLDDQAYPPSAYSFALDGTYDPVEFKVQYAESSLAFIQRLAEQEGVHYHLLDDGSVVFGDSNTAFPSSGISLLLDDSGGGSEASLISRVAGAGPRAPPSWWGSTSSSPARRSRPRRRPLPVSPRGSSTLPPSGAHSGPAASRASSWSGHACGASFTPAPEPLQGSEPAGSST